MNMEADCRWMQMAIGLSRRGLGSSWPNPSVGCVIISDDRVLAVGWTQSGGRPHAEAFALEQAAAGGIDVRGATAYVTLEPCAHFGKTPPCADALIAAGISRVVIATQDPDPRVAGKGIARLRESGIEVFTDVLKQEVHDVLSGYLMRLARQRPIIAMKTATSLDSKIALANGQSKWMTGSDARQFGHLLRAKYDGMIVGMGTIRADDPVLDCRLPGMAPQSPKIIIVDPNFSISPDARILADDRQHIVIGAKTDCPDTYMRCAALASRGHQIIRLEPVNGQLDSAMMAKTLGDYGFTAVLIEGGARTQAPFLAAGLVDRIWWFRGTKTVGAGGIEALSATFEGGIDTLPCWKLLDSRILGDDRVDLYGHY